MRLVLIGPAQLQRDDGNCLPLKPHDAALLALTAWQGPRSDGLSRESAAELLWPHSPRQRRLVNLRQRLRGLRLLAGRPVVQSGALLRLSDGTTVDALATPPPLPEHGFIALLAGIRLSAGEAWDAWLGEARAQWCERWRQAMHARLAAEQQAGRWEAALNTCTQLLAVDSADETAHQGCLRGHHLLGDGLAARRAWARCQAALRAAGSPPSATTRALAATVLDAADAAAAPPQQSPPLPLTLLRPPRLVGRRAELQAIQQAHRQQQAVVLTGPAGIGKSRLMEAATAGRAGALVVGFRPGDSAVPYRGLQRLRGALEQAFGALDTKTAGVLDAVAPGRGAPTGAVPLQPWRLQQCWQQALACWTGRGLRLLAVDDLQAADIATQELLVDSAHGRLPHGARLLLAAREIEAPTLERLLTQPADGTQPLCLPLPPLDDEALRALVASLSLPDADPDAWLPVLQRRCGGHPLWTLQVLSEALASGQPWSGALVQAAVPQQVQQLLGQRLRRLGAGALRLLRVAAVAGADHTLRLAADVLGCQPVDLTEAQAELEAAHLMRGEQPAFDLVTEVVLQALPDVVAQALHADLAQALQRRGAAPASIARHWQAAGRTDAAAPHAMAAAREARLSGRPADALAFADMALDGLGRAGDTAQRWRWAMQILPWAIGTETVPALNDRLARLRAWCRGVADVCDLELAASRLYLSLGDGAQALVHAESAAQRALALAAPLRQVQAAAWQGLALALCGRCDDATAAFAPWQDWLRRGRGPTAVRLAVHGALGFVLHSAGRLDQALQELQAAARLASRLGDHDEALEQWINLMVCHLGLGQRTAAIRAGERAAVHWREAGAPHSVAGMALHVQLATLHLAPGHYDRVLDLLVQALEWPALPMLASWRVIAEHRLALVWLRLGQPARARRLLTPLHANATVGNHVARVMMQCRLERAAAPAAARQALQQALAAWGDAADFLDRQALRLMLAGLSPATDALPLVDQVLAESQGRSAQPLVTHALARRAQALAELDRGWEAADAARAARDALQQAPPHDLEHAAFCALVLRAAEAGGDAVTANLALEDGLAWLRDALPHVPPPLRAGFWQHNAWNRALRLAALKTGRPDPAAVPLR